jgi:hypothetical protein
MTRDYVTSIKLMELYCLSTNQYAVFFSGLRTEEPRSSDPDEWGKYLEDRKKALIFLDPSADDYHQIMMDGEGFSIFDTEEEMEAFYDMIVGDDGPTKSNPYDGPIRVYALTCGPNGLMNENT